ncbi:protein-tyrosine kinase [Sulfuricella sp. T08]|uniref:XrtA-associated tyrosine autokinase n=1 Tax=Sulfuricella sp. T08 TaxID=1632857 RepID=UPI0006179C8B|nr:XrtA-associated tyrosine autokinase [Sulfuricella sp. T08]GAO34851.1 protein-tyrosine kinase [Sulfuricella sp. T08]
MSIIEKAAGKLDQIEKGEKTPPHEVTAKPPSGDSSSIIEKAAGKLDRIEKGEASSSAEMAPEIPEHPDQKAPSGNEGGGAGINPTLSAGGHVSKQGMINLAKLRQLGMIIPDGERTQIAEEFRLIKRPLIKNAFNQGAEAVHSGNLIMVTSALAGEGKTFCAANLAMSIAMELDHTVLLVDADVARPSLPKYLGLETGRGLLDVLLDDKLDLADVLIRTNVEKLSILQAGSRHKRATELLASQAMSDLLKEIARRYPDRVVIFDSPPLLLTSEAHVLASQMGQIVLVVGAESTTQQAVKEALRQIEACDIVNLIYNKARAFPGGGYYGYYG